MGVVITEEEYVRAARVSPSHDVRKEVWAETKFYCCHCGVKPLLVDEAGEGDYYVGPEYWCRACGRVYTMG